MFQISVELMVSVEVKFPVLYKVIGRIDIVPHIEKSEVVRGFVEIEFVH